MPRDPNSSRWSLTTLLGFGSVPGSPEEVRAFLQKRVLTYVGIAFSFWTVIWVVNVVLSFTLLSEEISRPFREIWMWPHLATAVALGVLWAAIRRRKRSIAVLGIIESAATLLQPVIAACLLTGMTVAITNRPEMAVIVGLTHILLARATMVPSTPARTAVLGALASAPIMLATYLLYAGAARLPAGVPDAMMHVIWIAIWCGIAVVATASVSHVIYGLHRQIREAWQLGQYTLEAKIGEGGMGVVYRARHALLRRPTAVKLLPPERAGATALARFEREVQLTSRLTHPNTVAVYDYGRTPEGVFYYAMELLEGLDLESVVRAEGHLPPARVVHVLRQAAGALAEAHRHGLIHRDVKPSNLVLCERGLQPDFVKVLDFGLVREVQSASATLTQVEALAGTPLYMSPEQIRDASRIDGRSDLYALGAVGYFLLTGTPVFEAGTVVEVCGHHLYSPVVPPSARGDHPIPAKLEALILSCLEKDRDQRPDDAAAFMRELAACDDVPPWTDEEAFRWWTERAPEVRAQSEPPSTPGHVLTVDLATRAGSRPGSDADGIPTAPLRAPLG